MDDYDGDRQIVAEALQRLLRWHSLNAVRFVEQWRIGELDDAAEHLRLVENASVGVAAVVYAVRMRLAGNDPRLKVAAAREAGCHARVIANPLDDNVTGPPPLQPKRVYRHPTFQAEEE